MNCLRVVNLPCRRSGHGRIRLDRMNHHRISTDYRVVANLNRAEDHAAYTENDVVPNLRAERRIKLHVKLFRAHIHSLEKRYIAADAPCSNDASGCMGDEEAWASFAPRRDFQTEQDQIRVAEKLRENRYACDQRGPAGTIQDDRKKAVMQ